MLFRFLQSQTAVQRKFITNSWAKEQGMGSHMERIIKFTQQRIKEKAFYESKIGQRRTFAEVELQLEETATRGRLRSHA